MPRAEEVDHGKFPVEQVLYDDGHFSVAYGWWEEEQEQRIGMRWNGQGDDAGYPSLILAGMSYFGHREKQRRRA